MIMPATITRLEQQDNERCRQRPLRVWLQRRTFTLLACLKGYLWPSHPLPQLAGMHYPERVWRRHSAYLMQLHQARCNDG